jgi:hypothetical protein
MMRLKVLRKVVPQCGVKWLLNEPQKSRLLIAVLRSVSTAICTFLLPHLVLTHRHGVDQRGDLGGDYRRSASEFYSAIFAN